MLGFRLFRRLKKMCSMAHAAHTSNEGKRKVEKENNK
jgi:hypothetical protein